MSTTELIAQARALLAAATPGPWTEDTWFGEVDGNDGVVSVGPHHIDLHDPDIMPEEPGHSDYAYDRACADAALIAAAPGLLAALCDEVCQLQSELGDALRSLKKAHEAMGSLLSIAGPMKHFIDHAAPMFSPDADGRAMAPNHVTTTLICGPERYEFTIRRWDGKTPGDIIGELQDALAAERQRADEAEAERVKRGPLRPDCPHDCDRGVIGTDGPGPDETHDYPCPHCDIDGETIRLLRIERTSLLARLHSAESERDAPLAEVERLKAENAAYVRRLAAVGDVLSANGCNCECGCDTTGHFDECDTCLACKINEAITDP